ncbi:hypothetical protein VTO42DRAFT_7840 [Malbranchea cinnamomea]
MPRIHFTPWKDHSELVALRDQFFPPPSYDGPDMREQACSLVWVWKARGNLPHSIEATALITGAVLHDDPSKHSVYSIQATYSTAFCRFVTALVDRTVHARKQTMYHLAGEIGIPASFVELRHEATHRDMPSLVTLQRVAQRSLEWLWQYYWATIEDAVPAEVFTERALRRNDQFTKVEIRKLVDPVIQKASGPSLPIKMRRTFEREYLLPIAKSVAKICQSQGAVPVAQVLLEDGILVSQPSHVDEHMDSFFSIWDKLLLALCNHHPAFLTVLVEEAAKTLIFANTPDEKEPTAYQEALYKWLERILTSKIWVGPRDQCLVLSYTKAICNTSDSRWAERLRPLLRDLPTSPEISVEDHSSINVNTANGDMRGRVVSTATAAYDKDPDIASLREYGWFVTDSRSSKPIGVA